MVCVLCNLKPAKMRDIVSQAMVLAASSSDGSKVEFIRVFDLFVVLLNSFRLYITNCFCWKHFRWS